MPDGDSEAAARARAEQQQRQQQAEEEAVKKEVNNLLKQRAQERGYERRSC